MHFRIMLWKLKIIIIKIRTYLLLYVWYKILSSSLYTLLKLSKTTPPNKLFDYDCVTLYIEINFLYLGWLIHYCQSRYFLPTSDIQNIMKTVGVTNYRSKLACETLLRKNLAKTMDYIDWTTIIIGARPFAYKYLLVVRFREVWRCKNNTICTKHPV